METALRRPVYSFVLPIYNEEQTLTELYLRLCLLFGRLDGEAEVIMVDDGSSDGSYSLMLEIHRSDSRFKVLRLSRNFGHQTAITAGLDFAGGAAVIVMDADLQDPPEVALQMAARWREGYEIVYAVREERAGETWFKRWTADLFYRLQRRVTRVDIPANVGDFRLIDRKALDVFRQMREQNRYLRGMFSWIGFRQTGVRFRRDPRFAGQPKYTFLKSLQLAIDALLGFSYLPLRMAPTIGLPVAALSILYGIGVIGFKLAGKNIPGWTSLAVLISFLGGMQLMMLGVIGEYLGRIHAEVKDRPLYVISDQCGFEETPITLPSRAFAPVHEYVV